VRIPVPQAEEQRAQREESERAAGELTDTVATLRAEKVSHLSPTPGTQWLTPGTCPVQRPSRDVSSQPRARG